MNKILKMLSCLLAMFLIAILICGVTLSNNHVETQAAEETIVLRVCNWEEYIDEGDWDEDEVIDLESGDIFGESSMVEDFENWFREVYGRDIRVEYSCFGTNEELYSQLTLGDVYDIVCPSEYMFMKMMAEDMLVPLSDEFFDEENEYNYYINGVSPFIKGTFEENEINGEPWSKYAACYMWGITGIVYNPEIVSDEEAGTWQVLENPKYYRQVTVKDNVRDTFFAAMGILKHDLLTSDEFLARDDYHSQLAVEINETSDERLAEIEDLLKRLRQNTYSFETDSGKADMVTGKVVANLQWSGDAVYTMDQAEEDDVYLSWATPIEASDLYLDGWVMLKSGIEENKDKQMAAEAFINFVSRPDNAVRNMYYIGYTSAIAGGDDTTIYDYMDWCYGAEEEDDAVEYPVGYFFSGDNEDEDYILYACPDYIGRQLTAQYPTEEEIARTAIMQYFDADANARVNQMWINIRCFNLSQITAQGWITVAIVFATIVLTIVLLFVIKRVYVFHRVAKRTNK